MHPGQIRLAAAYIARDQTKWRAAFLTVCMSAGNRAGKTLALSIVILHSLFYKMGMRPPGPSDHEVERWTKARYEWYHFGIQQEVSELVFFEIQRIHAGTHEAQPQGCPLTNEAGPDWATLDKKWRGEYRWVVLNPAFGGAELHFRTTSEKGLGSLGKEMMGLSFDECGFEPNLTFIIDEVMDMRRLGTGGQMFLISTPSEGFTQFSDVWKRGDPNDPERDPSRISLRMSTRDNLGYGIDAAIFERIIAGYPEHLIPQNIDGHFIEGRSAFFDARSVDAMFDKDLDRHYDALAEHEYIQGVDPAIRRDGAWSIVVDITNRDLMVGVDVYRRKGRQTVQSLVVAITDQHEAYDDRQKGSSCTTGMDTTGFGGSVFRDLMSGVSPFRSVEFGGTRDKKLRLLTNLKTLIEQGKFRFPRQGAWLDLRRQLLGYRLDRDKKDEQDAVMALAIVARLVSLSPAQRGAVDFDYFHPPVQTESGFKPPSRDWERLLSRGGGGKMQPILKR